MQNATGHVSNVQRTGCQQTLGDGSADFGAVERNGSLQKRRRFLVDAQNGRQSIVPFAQRTR